MGPHWSPGEPDRPDEQGLEALQPASGRFLRRVLAESCIRPHRPLNSPEGRLGIRIFNPQTPWAMREQCVSNACLLWLVDRLPYLAM